MELKELSKKNKKIVLKAIKMFKECTFDVDKRGTLLKFEIEFCGYDKDEIDFSIHVENEHIGYKKLLIHASFRLCDKHAKLVQSITESLQWLTKKLESLFVKNAIKEAMKEVDDNFQWKSKIKQQLNRLKSTAEDACNI